MTDGGERYARQVRLSEVSMSGQEKLGAAVIAVRGRDGADVERAYLERAGVGLVTADPDADPDPFRHAGEFRFAATRRVGGGAWRALARIRSVLGLERP